MKKLFKVLGYALGVLILLALAGAAFIYFRGIPDYPYAPTPEIQALKVNADSIRVERGAKIASLLCSECHKNTETGRLTGRIMLDLPKEFGTVVSLNITRDPERGIGAWTDGELYYFLRTGIRKNGSWAPPTMPKFPLMADEDLYSVIAWLRSSDRQLDADSKEYPPNNYNMLIKFLGHVAFFPPELPAQPIAIPDSLDQVAFGRYVADALCSCYACHSADFTKQDALHPEKSFLYYAGGNPMLDLEGNIVPTANITFDKETGIGNWTIEQFRDAVKYNKNPRGGLLHFPMFPHTTLSDTEVDAVYAFLKTVTPIKNPVARYQGN